MKNLLFKNLSMINYKILNKNKANKNKNYFKFAFKMYLKIFII